MLDLDEIYDVAEKEARLWFTDVAYDWKGFEAIIQAIIPVIRKQVIEEISND